MRVLIVDDDMDIRFALTSVFQAKFNLTVVEATSGEHAIQTLIQEKFNLIVSDLEMSNGDGLTIVDYLKEKKLDTPFIFFSGSKEIQAEDHAPYVLKAFSKDELLSLVDYIQHKFQLMHK